jgi:hypothetical protein
MTQKTFPSLAAAERWLRWNGYDRWLGMLTWSAIGGHVAKGVEAPDGAVTITTERQPKDT